MNTLWVVSYPQNRVLLRIWLGWRHKIVPTTQNVINFNGISCKILHVRCFRHRRRSSSKRWLLDCFRHRLCRVHMCCFAYNMLGIDKRGNHHGRSHNTGDERSIKPSEECACKVSENAHGCVGVNFTVCHFIQAHLIYRQMFFHEISLRPPHSKDNRCLSI